MVLRGITSGFTRVSLGALVNSPRHREIIVPCVRESLSNPRPPSVLFLACLVLGLSASGARGAQPQSEPPVAERAQALDGPQGELLNRVLDRLDHVERELKRLRAKDRAIPADKTDQRVFALLENPYLGADMYGTPNGSRFFVARLVFVNLTPQPITVTRDRITLDADGNTNALGDVPTELQHRSIQTGNGSTALRDLKPAKQVELASGGSGGTWVVFPGLPQSPGIPEMVLRFRVGDERYELNVNQFVDSRLGLAVERIGPHRCLALLTIAGTLDTINVGTLVDALNDLARQKVVRAVIRWSGSAATVDAPILSWLQQAVVQAGRGEALSSPFPAIPPEIRELHLAEVPNRPSQSLAAATARPASLPGTVYAPPHVHNTLAEAVTASLASAYRNLPRNELLLEIENGPLPTRAAALSIGGGRLSSGQLPVILKYADDNELPMQMAALTALRHFGEPEAIARLAYYARKNVEPLATTAIESLAGSRYAPAHDALLGLLSNEDTESRRSIVTVLARFPRPIWSDTIYQFATDANSGIRFEAIQALVRIGHPELFGVLRESLQNGSQAMKDEAFRVLAIRSDPQSEQAALEYTLKYLEKSPPTSQMDQLLRRTKDRRAVDLLLKHLPHAQPNRLSLINTLAQIGDESVGEPLARLYSEFSSSEKAAVLNALVAIHSPQFRPLAAEALQFDDTAAISAACQGLQADASPAAVRLLAEAMEKSANASAWSYVSTALAAVGTPDARAALIQARAAENPRKCSFAANAMQQLYRRSPGFSFVHQARLAEEEEKWQTAITQYELAVQADPLLPDAYAGRAYVQLRLDHLDEARRDFQKAVELDPYDAKSVTGAALVMVLGGEYEQGIRSIEEARNRFTKGADDHDEERSLFAYNAACVYGRAIEKIQEDGAAADRAERVTAYRQKALADLRRAVQTGFNEFSWMKEDPDLETLRHLPEFQELCTPPPAEGKKETEKEAVGDAAERVEE